MSRSSVPNYAREVVAAVLAHRIFTVVTVLLVGGGTLLMLMTSGRSAATEEAVLRTIDAQGTRTILVQVQTGEALLSGALVDALAGLPEVESVLGLGPVRDATAAAVPDGPRIGIRTAYGTLSGQPISQPDATIGVGSVVWASPRSAEAVGLPAGAGTLRLVDGPEYLVIRALSVPDFLSGYEPLAIIPAGPGPTTGSFTTVVVLARSPQAVPLVARLASSFLVDLPRDAVAVSTSEQMATLRAAIGGELTQQSRAIVLSTLAAVSAATALAAAAFTLLRRKDTGRRRALGATRLTILSLVVGQVLVASIVGSLAGAAAGVTWLWIIAAPVPSPPYVLAVATGLSLGTTLAATIPATVAATRDPLRELRVP